MYLDALYSPVRLSTWPTAPLIMLQLLSATLCVVLPLVVAACFGSQARQTAPIAAKMEKEDKGTGRGWREPWGNEAEDPNSERLLALFKPNGNPAVDKMMLEMRMLVAYRPYNSALLRPPGASMSIKYLNRHMSDYTEEEMAAYVGRVHQRFPGSLVTLTEGCIRANIDNIGDGDALDGVNDALLLAREAVDLLPLPRGGENPEVDDVAVEAGGHLFQARGGARLGATAGTESQACAVVQSIAPHAIAARASGAVIACTCTGVGDGERAVLLYEAAPLDVRLASQTLLDAGAGGVVETQLEVPGWLPPATRLWVQIIGSEAFRGLGMGAVSDPVTALLLPDARAAAEISELLEAAGPPARAAMVEAIGATIMEAGLAVPHTPQLADAAAYVMDALCMGSCTAAVRLLAPYVARCGGLRARSLGLAIMTGDITTVELLAQQVDISESIGDGGATAMHVAAALADGAPLEALLCIRGAKASWLAMQGRDHSGRTPLDVAAIMGHWSNVERIHEHAGAAKDSPKSPTASDAGQSSSVAWERASADVALNVPDKKLGWDFWISAVLAVIPGLRGAVLMHSRHFIIGAPHLLSSSLCLVSMWRTRAAAPTWLCGAEQVMTFPSFFMAAARAESCLHTKGLAGGLLVLYSAYLYYVAKSELHMGDGYLSPRAVEVAASFVSLVALPLLVSRALHPAPCHSRDSEAEKLKAA
eukprot:CAMPEP_0182855472 /NCGR_PEP_ID=MMETSP0034_2-20130328/1860_1 /TAXON_ID=156128 /ORGANISM="Nephroselmis pyriformis, Strain CCMP717" /LENGTH=704 /DNA_ID=CAMNT_0024986441 /DNA_START=349 /DNA_END=2463 /DNA_ORIENTATION=-